MDRYKFRVPYYDAHGKFTDFRFVSLGVFPPVIVGCYPRLSEAQQFTGIADKNGTEVYEGDIVDIEHTTLVFQEDRVSRGEVVFGDRGAFGVKVPNKQNKNAKDIKKRHMFFSFHPSKSFTIIGNIHQTAEQA